MAAPHCSLRFIVPVYFFARSFNSACMDAETEQRASRNSRWTRDPVIRDGAATVARITEHDIQIFRLLARYHYLQADDIRAFVGGALTPLVRRLNLLSRKPNLYINRPQQQRQSCDANHRPLVYELDDRGANALCDPGWLRLPRSSHSNFAHELMVCRIRASIELGVRADPSLRLITWTEILASERTPLDTRRSLRPAQMPVSLSSNGEHRQIMVRADGTPFGLELSRDGRSTYLFFPGIEADCGTEPVTASDIERSSIYKKFAAYLAIAQQNIHRSHFGFPNLFVPFVTTTRSRMESMMALLDRLTDGRGSKMFLFKTFPALTSAESPLPPSGAMLTQPWTRVGVDPFIMADP